MPFGAAGASETWRGAAIDERPAGTGRRVGIGEVSGGAIGVRVRAAGVEGVAPGRGGASRGAGELGRGRGAGVGSALAAIASGASGSAADSAAGAVVSSAPAAGAAAGLARRGLSETGLSVGTGSSGSATLAGLRAGLAAGLAAAGATLAVAGAFAPAFALAPRRTPRTRSAIGSSTTLSWFLASNPSCPKSPINSFAGKPSSLASSKIRTFPVGISSFLEPKRGTIGCVGSNRLLHVFLCSGRC